MREQNDGIIPICPGVGVIPVRSATLPPATHTNVWVLGDHHVTIVDPASPFEEEQERLDEILEMVLVERILLTHHHNDHIDGALAIQKTTGARIAAHPKTRDRVAFPIDELLDDGAVVGTDAGFWRVIHTPGHAQGHICLFNGGLSTVVAGDMVAGEGTILLDPPEGNLKQYLKSLEYLLSLKPDRLLPAHGPVITPGVECLENYIAHRHMRSEQILGTLAGASGMTASQLAAHIYKGIVPESFLGIATRQVLCHLLSLESDGLACSDGDTYYAVSL